MAKKKKNIKTDNTKDFVKKMDLTAETPLQPIIEVGMVVEAPKQILTITDHLEAAIELLKPMANPQNECIRQAYNMLTRHTIHLVRTGLKDIK